MASPVTRTHIEYVYEVMSFRSEISTLLALFPHATDTLTTIDRELTSLIQVLPTPSIPCLHTVCCCLTESEYFERIRSIDRRIDNLVQNIRTPPPTTTTPTIIPMNHDIQEYLTDNQYQYYARQVEEHLLHRDTND